MDMEKTYQELQTTAKDIYSELDQQQTKKLRAALPAQKEACLLDSVVPQVLLSSADNASRQGTHRSEQFWKFVALGLAIICLLLLCVLVITVLHKTHQNKYLMEENMSLKTNISQTTMDVNNIQAESSSFKMKKDNITENLKDAYCFKPKTIRPDAPNWLFKCNEETCSTGMEVAVYNKILNICPNQWLMYNQRCYFISEENRTRDQSGQYCKSQGAALLTINDKKELYFIIALMDKNSYYWTGLSCSRANAVIWDDETPLETNLFNGYCSRPGCVAIWSDSVYSHACSQPEQWICEKASTQIEM